MILGNKYLENQNYQSTDLVAEKAALRHNATLYIGK